MPTEKSEPAVPGLKTNISPGRMIDNTLDIILRTQLAARGLDLENDEEIKRRVARDLVLPEGTWVYKLDGIPIVTFRREQVTERTTAFSLNIEQQIEVVR